MLTAESAWVIFIISWKELCRWFKLGAQKSRISFAAHTEIELNVEINIGPAHHRSINQEQMRQPRAIENGRSAEFDLLNTQNEMQ